MYAGQLERILTLVRAANDSNKDSETPDGEVYTHDIPVLLDGELMGFIRDEIGGAYNYVPATEKERAWWDQRPSASWT